uniref:hypothetical protein n=1 Tax=Sedimenticola sp. TaxID=1940285 RepID=UPI003D145968
MESQMFGSVVAALIEKAKEVEYFSAEKRFYLRFKNFAEGQPDPLVPLDDVVASVCTANKNAMSD